MAANQREALKEFRKTSGCGSTMSWWVRKVVIRNSAARARDARGAPARVAVVAVAGGSGWRSVDFHIVIRRSGPLRNVRAQTTTTDGGRRTTATTTKTAKACYADASRAGDLVRRRHGHAVHRVGALQRPRSARRLDAIKELWGEEPLRRCARRVYSKASKTEA